MNVNRPEILQLLSLVEEKFGRVLDSTTDFNDFSLYLQTNSYGALSASTLKRLWGYVNDSHAPRKQTLDILSNYIGHSDFAGFCAYLRTSNAYNSSFFPGDQIVSSNLAVGNLVEIGWAPNRYVRLIYQGDSMYQVVESLHSKLMIGDRFSVSFFLKGKTLFLPFVERNGQRLPAFLAGRNGGLTLLNLMDAEHENR